VTKFELICFTTHLVKLCQSCKIGWPFLQIQSLFCLLLSTMKQPANFTILNVTNDAFCKWPDHQPVIHVCNRLYHFVHHCMNTMKQPAKIISSLSVRPDRRVQVVPHQFFKTGNATTSATDSHKITYKIHNVRNCVIFFRVWGTIFVWFTTQLNQQLLSYGQYNTMLTTSINYCL